MDYEQIYEHHADAYDALVAAEDCEGNLAPAIEAIVPLASTSVLEVGVGTGRMTRLLLPRVAKIIGVERSPAMLAVARRHLQASGSTSWQLHCADARALPVPSGWADLAIAAWVFGHLRYWMPTDWKENIGKALAEMRRALKSGGGLIILETLGTGRDTPVPPSPELEEYYRWLEDEHNMRRSCIRTDYLFPDVETAAKITGFFFGDEFAARVRHEAWTRVPECTGLWSVFF